MMCNVAAYFPEGSVRMDNEEMVFYSVRELRNFIKSVSEDTMIHVRVIQPGNDKEEGGHGEVEDKGRSGSAKP